MSTVLIVIGLIVVFVLIVGAILYAGPGKGGRGRGGLKRRFGPEYDRAVARHDGDTKAAEQELSERVSRHGDLRTQALSAEQREQYVALWGGLQERFVDAPQEAVTEADRLLARLAADRGYPDTAYDDQLDALSVHHAHQVDGYRQVHHAASDEGRGASTEELREAMVGARQLFEQLISAHPEEGGAGRPGSAGRTRNLSLRPKGSGA